MTDQSLDALREEARETLIVDIKNLLTWAAVGAESDAGEDLLARLNSLLAALPREPRKNADGLLPCPFCGSDSAFHVFDAEAVAPYGHTIECGKCAALTGSCRSEEHARETWNTRATVPEDRAGLAERLRAKGYAEVPNGASQSTLAVIAGAEATSAPEARGGLIERAEKTLRYWEDGIRREAMQFVSERHVYLLRDLLAALSPRPDGEPEAGQEVKRG